jgi:hypothetical protein
VKRDLGLFPADIMVMRLPRLELAHLGNLAKIRTVFPRVGLITVTDSADPAARYHAREISGLKLLLAPLELNDLQRIVEKMLRREASALRLHSRVHREGGCEIVDPETGKVTPASFLDFAQMGARVRLHPREPFRRNNRLQLRYRSTTEPSRVHRIECHVMWAEVKSGIVGTLVHGPEQVMGLRFIAAL